ncbi:uncharacterized protein A1O9_05949 [Exophiala aquamarina CBS 119918]|uniref:Uncharacterized protein n=1 Tax=Exophiala aquamarina CBS 119918 TaxID=1182545 RepID=A0A072PDT1_9EURO|nr:uncharacterized protein A1O9_05949 [Exophiala aquamarina CBS 119918]KEF58026.1 hypothetical protein A1O9_05949 [Exophiala aquamarina CBS 119918]
MSPKPETVRALFAPFPNYSGIPTINIYSYEVPLPAYWRIAELLHDGIPKQQVVQLIVLDGGIKTRRSVEEVITAITDNHRLMTAHASKRTTEAAVGNGSKANRSSNRLSTLLLSTNAESHLEEFKPQEKQQLSTTLALARRKEKLGRTGVVDDEDERRRTIAAIDYEIKKTLQRHAEIETQIEYARRLTVMR